MRCYLLPHEGVAVVVAGRRAHGGVGVVPQVALGGPGLAPHLGARQHQRRRAVWLHNTKLYHADMVPNILHLNVYDKTSLIYCQFTTTLTTITSLVSNSFLRVDMVKALGCRLTLFNGTSIVSTKDVNKFKHLNFEIL